MKTPTSHLWEVDTPECHNESKHLEAVRPPRPYCDPEVEGELLRKQDLFEQKQAMNDHH
jgi:hypothetical protein